MARKGLIALLLSLFISLAFINPAYAGFSDVPPTTYYYTAVSSLASKSVITGFSDGKYHPEELVTRAQMAKLIAVTKGISLTASAVVNTSFSDVPSSHWASPFIKASAAAGIVKGYEDGSFKPDQPITRAELARILRRTIEMPVLNPANATFKDISSGYRAYGEIETVAHYGIMSGYADKTFRPAEKANRAQTAVVLFRMINANLQSPAPEPEPVIPPVENPVPADDGKIIVVVDPGHGGSDPGALAKKDGEIFLKEKDINLAVALKVRDLLKAGGFEVVMTRTTDVYVGLSERAQIANNANADIFVSVHHNSASTSTAEGTSVYHYPGSQNGARLAQLIQDELIKAFGWDGVANKDRGIHGANFAVLRETVMTAALCESAFMSNPSEAELLATDEFRQKEAIAIYNGITKYFNK